MATWPTTNGWAYTWSSTVSANTAPNCCTLTLPVVNAVSLSFHPERVLSLCCVNTLTDWGFGAIVSVGLSLQVASTRNASGSGSLRLTMETRCRSCGHENAPRSQPATEHDMPPLAQEELASLECGALSSPPHREAMMCCTRSRFATAFALVLLACGKSAATKAAEVRECS